MPLLKHSAAEVAGKAGQHQDEDDWGENTVDNDANHEENNGRQHDSDHSEKTEAARRLCLLGLTLTALKRLVQYKAVFDVSIVGVFPFGMGVAREKAIIDQRGAFVSRCAGHVENQE